MTKQSDINKVISWLVGGEPKPDMPDGIILNILNELDVRILEEKEIMSQEIMKETEEKTGKSFVNDFLEYSEWKQNAVPLKHKPSVTEAWNLCRPCGEKKYGKLENDMAITMMEGDCKYCGEKNVTLIPIDDFIGQGD